MAALPADRPISGDDQVPLDVLAEDLIIFLRENGTLVHDAILAMFERRGLKPNITRVASRALAGLAMVAAGVGAAIVPAAIVEISRSRELYSGLSISTKTFQAGRYRLHTCRFWHAVTQQRCSPHGDGRARPFDFHDNSYPGVARYPLPGPSAKVERHASIPYPDRH
jgi:DNA-binding transcriptional LysR family regulator